jgi:hypothetical protein
MKKFQESVSFDQERPSRTERCCGKEIAMLLFYLPLIIFEAMLPSPKRTVSKPASDKAFEPNAG